MNFPRYSMSKIRATLPSSSSISSVVQGTDPYPAFSCLFFAYTSPKSFNVWDFSSMAMEELIRLSFDCLSSFVRPFGNASLFPTPTITISKGNRQRISIFVLKFMVNGFTLVVVVEESTWAAENRSISRVCLFSNGGFLSASTLAITEGNIRHDTTSYRSPEGEFAATSQEAGFRARP